MWINATFRLILIKRLMSVSVELLLLLPLVSALKQREEAVSLLAPDPRYRRGLCVCVCVVTAHPAAAAVGAPPRPPPSKHGRAHA